MVVHVDTWDDRRPMGDVAWRLWITWGLILTPACAILLADDVFDWCKSRRKDDKVEP